jgi:hypothetical protein
MNTKTNLPTESTRVSGRHMHGVRFTGRITKVSQVLHTPENLYRLFVEFDQPIELRQGDVRNGICMTAKPTGSGFWEDGFGGNLAYA